MRYFAKGLVYPDAFGPPAQSFASVGLRGHDIVIMVGVTEVSLGEALDMGYTRVATPTQIMPIKEWIEFMKTQIPVDGEG